MHQLQANWKKLVSFWNSFPLAVSLSATSPNKRFKNRAHPEWNHLLLTLISKTIRKAFKMFSWFRFTLEQLIERFITGKSLIIKKIVGKSQYTLEAEINVINQNFKNILRTVIKLYKPTLFLLLCILSWGWIQNKRDEHCGNFAAICCDVLNRKWFVHCWVCVCVSSCYLPPF